MIACDINRYRNVKDSDKSRENEQKYKTNNYTPMGQIEK